jgi:hypothetical protein
MDITPEARRRLAGIMDERRLDLGLTWKEVAIRGGLSYEAVRALRTGDEGNPEPLTLRKIDRGLEWMPGSSRRVLYEGGEPEDVLSPEERRTLERYAQGVVSPAAGRERNGKSA